jgi:hypothetical protein
VLAIGRLRQHQTVSATLILLVVLHVCFFPFVWGDKTLLSASRGGVPSIMPNGAWYGGSQGPATFRGNDMGASGWVSEPDAALVRHQYFAEKHLPLWNPYQSYGAPLAANMQSQPFHPLFGLLALSPGPRTYNLFILARFLLAGLFTYLYLRLFLSFTASVAGGIACMLSGYFILFFNMPHLSVEIFIPAVFLATERLLRDESMRNVGLSIAITFLCIVGGMPESAFLALVFGGSYFLYRLVTDARLRGAAGRHLKYFVFAQGMGLALAGFLLIPFVEFMRLSFDSHQPANLHGLIVGLKHDRWGLSIFTYVVPTLFGTAWGNAARGLSGYEDLRGFAGVAPMLFAAIAVFGLVRHRDRYPTLFFFGAAIAIVLKRYGAPGVNWIGHLPLFQLIEFRKYDEPLLAFAVAVLGAFGVEQVLSGMVNRRRMVTSILAMLALLMAAGTLSWPKVTTAKVPPNVYYLSLAGAGGILFLAAVLLLGPAKPAARAWMPAALLALLTTDMAGQYIYPVYYVQTRSARDDSNPYRGAPYIDCLMTRTEGCERVFGRDGILHPGWAGSFQLEDIRGLDAMYYRKYFDFIRFFLRDQIPPGDRGELTNRFTGMRWPAIDHPLERRLLQLSSVKFLLSTETYTPEGRAQEIIEQNRGRLIPGRENLIEVRTFTIGGETKPVLFEHPPYERLPFRFTVTPDSREFLFSVAMQPAVYDGSMPICGAGVQFRLEVRDSAGSIRELYARYIDPKHNLAERRWIPGAVDLSGYMGQTVELLFTTAPGPAGDTCAAWGGWGDPHLNGDTGESDFKLVYDRGVKIYEYRETLPRAALFSTVELVADDGAALARLGSPAFDIFGTAVISTKGLPASDWAALDRLTRMARERVRAARIIAYSSQEARIDALTERPALLMLNDSDYPGWNVYVDGRRSHWITANYLFRGVLLAPGRHFVRFTYEPASFRTGAAISAAALVCLAGFVLWRLRIAKTHLVQ